MRDILQRTHICLWARCAPTDQQHRHSCQGSVGDGRDGVRDAWPGRHHGNAELASELSMRVGHVHRGPFVAHIDDPDAELGDMVPDRLNMAALEPENAVDAAGLKKPRDPGRARLFVCVQIID